MPAITPLGECRSNVEVFRALAERMGFDDDCFRESVDEMIDAALHSENPRLRGIDRERLQREGHVRLNFENQLSDHGSQLSDFLPFAEGNFGTKSGKAELYSEDVKAQGLDPVAAFTPPDESRHGSKANSFPLELLARKADNFSEYYVLQCASGSADGRGRICSRSARMTPGRVRSWMAMSFGSSIAGAISSCGRGWMALSGRA